MLDKIFGGVLTFALLAFGTAAVISAGFDQPTAQVEAKATTATVTIARATAAVAAAPRVQ